MSLGINISESLLSYFLFVGASLARFSQVDRVTVQFRIIRLICAFGLYYLFIKDIANLFMSPSMNICVCLEASPNQFLKILSWLN